LPQVETAAIGHCDAGFGVVPAGSDAHVPGDVESAHETQLPVHAVEQQTPWAQKFELHSVAVVQETPFAFLPQLPVVVLQTLLVMQSLLPAQVVLHAVALAQTYGSQATFVTVWQLPAPSHRRGGVSVEPVQLPATHWVVDAQYRHLPVPSHIPSSPQVVDTDAMHCAAATGAVPFGTLVQVPTLFATVHDWQVPVQALLQQTPCTQLLEAHSVPAAQVRPSGLSVQAPPLQMLGATQSASALQVALHDVPPVSQVRLPGQAAAVAAVHVPAPSQLRAGVSDAPLHIAPTHWVVFGHFRQPPFPSQVPSSPQLAIVVAVHWPDGAVVPATIGEQVPTLFVTVQDMHVPVQPLLQQTPDTQNPELQSAPAPHEAPMGLSPQLMLRHMFGETHWVLSVQVVLHALAPHTNGEQVVSMTVRQTPDPSHDRAGVSVEPVQAAGAQVVETAKYLHLPAPSQVPSSPQVDAVDAGHWLATSGAAPLAIDEHLPSLPGRLQATQAASQPVSQQ
jgi:hypothetical protein